MGGAVSSGENNDALVDNLIQANYIKNSAVERVFRAVDRAFYYTDEFKSTAYKDLAWKHGNLHLSAPCIYSQVMESLELECGLSFLNLGSGTGYLSTMAGLILGSRGLNHGIEIHPDVIEYANERLQTFLMSNSAMDEYEFCVPHFEQGNCLSLAPANRRYHRVYCGAACPENYENYMKQLIQVGGILVMPMNDQLLQIRRVDENSWNVTSVLPVSFASLVAPAQDITEDVILPPAVPHSLQNLCRFEIRAVLKQNVESEHPTLWQLSRKHPKERKRSQSMRRCVLPLFEDTDSDTDSVAEAEVEEIEEEEEEESNDEDVHIPDEAEEPIERRSGVRRADSENDSDDRAKTKREKFDSGVSDLFESGSERSPPSSSTVESSPSGSQASPTITSTEDHSRNPPPDPLTSCNCNEGANQEDGVRSSLSGIRLIAHSIAGERDRTALVIFESHLTGSDDNSSDSNDEDETMTDQDVDSSNVIPQQNYSYHMKKRLMDLPLPFALKSFLNYDRVF